MGCEAAVAFAKDKVMISRTTAMGALLIWVLAVSAASAQGTCEVSGTVVDQDGNPVPDVRVKFAPAGNLATPYDGTTSKKGRYAIAGMFNPSNEGMWVIEVTAAGHVPVGMEIESRNAQHVLMGQVRKVKLTPGAPLPQIMIRPLGSARVDFQLATPEQAAALSGAAAGQPGAAPAAAPQVDPWDMALSRVADGDLAGSIEFFGKAIEAKPDDAQRHESLAKVLYRLKRYDEAELSAQKAIELAPDASSARMVLYGVYVGKGDLASAEKVLNEARAAAPDDPDILHQVAYVASQSGNSAKAIEAHETLVRLDPADADSWLALANLYAEKGDMAKSEAAYQKVIELDPGGAPQVFFNLGALIMNKDDRSDADTQRAIGAFRKAIELKPDYREAHKQLAFALLGANDRAGAKSELERCVELAPDAPDSPQMKALIQSLR